MNAGHLSCYMFTILMHDSPLSTQEGATDHSKPLFCLMNANFSSQTWDLSFFRAVNIVRQSQEDRVTSFLL